MTEENTSQDRPFASSGDEDGGGFIEKNKKILLAGVGGLVVVLAGYVLVDTNFSSSPKVSGQDIMQKSAQAKLDDAAQKARQELEAKGLEAQPQAQAATQAMAQASGAGAGAGAGADLPTDPFKVMPPLPGAKPDILPPSNMAGAPGTPGKGDAIAAAAAIGTAANAAKAPAPSVAAPQVQQPQQGQQSPGKDDRIAALEQDVQMLKEELDQLKKRHAARPKQSAPRQSARADGQAQEQGSGGMKNRKLPHLATLGSGAYLSATPDKLTLLSGGREIEVRAGQRFPNGSTYIGFDTITQVVKTDQGDYRVN